MYRKINMVNGAGRNFVDYICDISVNRVDILSEIKSFWRTQIIINKILKYLKPHLYQLNFETRVRRCSKLHR